jgi:hypothetical protein
LDRSLDETSSVDRLYEVIGEALKSPGQARLITTSRYLLRILHALFHSAPLLLVFA